MARLLKTPTDALTAMDLFCGCGGMTVGLEQAGFAVLSAIDNDPLAVETYRMNHKAVRVVEGDIRKANPMLVAHEAGLERGTLDLLAGCPPCQGFSSLRTHNGARVVDDPRNDLLFEFLRFVEALMPRAIMFENVPGLVNDPRFSQFGIRLAEIGYQSSTPQVLNAADYGVPQRRRRLFMAAGLGFAVGLCPPMHEHCSVRDAIGSLAGPGMGDDPLQNVPESHSDEVLRRIQAIPKDGGSRLDLGRDQQLPCHRKCNGFKDIYGRLSWDGVAPTITSGCTNPSKGRFLHPEQDRALTLREAALLQSFPDNYKFSMRGGKAGASRMIGNAVPPELARRQALQLRAALERQASKSRQ